MSYKKLTFFNTRLTSLRCRFEDRPISGGKIRYSCLQQRKTADKIIVDYFLYYLIFCDMWHLDPSRWEIDRRRFRRIRLSFKRTGEEYRVHVERSVVRVGSKRWER